MPQDLRTRAVLIVIFSAVATPALVLYLVGAWKRRTVRLICRGRIIVYKRDSNSFWYWYTWILYFAIATFLFVFMLISLYRLYVA
jgi:hypothetical protein